MLALVVDDSRAMRSIVSGIAAAIGYETTQAGDGAEALEMLENGCTPDLMLVDWNMPRMNGLELVRNARTLPHLSGTRIVMVTTEADTEQVTAALTAGANEYVMKPFTKEILSEKLQTMSTLEDLV